MAGVADAKVAKHIRRVIRKAEQHGEEYSVRIVRLRVEKELGLPEGFLQKDQWKQKSRDLIKACAAGDAAPTSSSPSGPSKRIEAKTTPKASRIEVANSRDAAEPSPVRMSAKASYKNTNDSKPMVQSQDSGKSGSSSEDEDESSSDSSEISTPVKSKRLPPATKIAVPNGTALSAHGAKRKDTSDDSSTEADTAAEEVQPQRKKKKLESSKASAIHSRFQPPHGFRPLDSSKLISSSALSEQQLNGKEIWHIVAPSNVPLDTVTVITRDAIKSKAPILNHNNTEYILNEDTENQANSASHILLPTKDGYESTLHRTHRTFHLQESISLPTLPSHQISQLSGSDAAADILRPSVVNIPPQRKGLKMRYHPPGSGLTEQGHNGSDSESDDVQLNRQPVFKKPAQVPRDPMPTQVKSKSSDMSVLSSKKAKPERHSSPEKIKEKKHEKSKKTGAPSEAVSKAVVPESPLNAKAGHSEPIDDTAKEDKEAKKRRKEERKARKEAKRKEKSSVES